MKDDGIEIVGAREHNLKNIDLQIPRGKLTVITGLSGSGKSSLAFDTLFAEGQRKYVESLSAYARQFLNQMQKPELDHISGLSPAIAIEQRTAGNNPRSIVATATEIHDYLRLLFANIGHAHCHTCGREVTRQSAQDIVQQLLHLENGTRAMVLAPIVSGGKGKQKALLESIRKDGFVRIRVDGEICEIEACPELKKNKKHTLDAVVDRLVISNSAQGRIADSVELALKKGAGQIKVLIERENGWEERSFSEKNACLHCGISFSDLSARSFSFNSPYGACAVCHGLGNMLVLDENLIIPDRSLPLEKAIHAWRRGGRRLIIYYKKLLRALSRKYEIDLSTPVDNLPEEFYEILLHGSGQECITYYMRRRKISKPFEGIIPNLERLYRQTESDYVRKRIRKYMNRQLCTACGGARLKPASLACQVAGHGIHEVLGMSIRTAHDFFTRKITQAGSLSPQEMQIGGEILKEIRERLKFLIDVGLDYLTLDRESGTLSGGEAQRIRLATQIGAGLVGVLYVLDEPTIGLHQRDNLRLLRSLQDLRDLGNTIVVVEHDEQTIRAADHLIDLGPGAGVSGGELVFEGSIENLLQNPDSLTANYLNGELKIEVPRERHSAEKGFLEIKGAAENNLKGIDVGIPIGLFSCITGVSGSGKSTLIDDILRKALFRHFHNSKARPGKHKKLVGVDKIDRVVVISQKPIGRTPRSNAATYTGLFTVLRRLFAELPASKVRGYDPGRYSFNLKGGRCAKCKGDGVLKIEMHFLPDIYVPCEECDGRRYNQETLKIRYRNKNIADVLEMTIAEALEFFAPIPKVKRRLQTLADVGLGYLHLGQPATTLSGGEAQRIKLATELSKRSTGRMLYLLDEPTTGLHFGDVHKLLEVLERLRDEGNSVVVIEHNLDVIKRADYLIDLGPGGGESGGEIVACGTPEEIANCPESQTGKFIKEIL